MNRFLLSGITIASVLMLQPAPASAQRVHAVGHARVGHGYAGHWHGGYGHGYGGYGVGVGVGALATGALIGGAIASQNQGYYYGDQDYPGYSDPGYVYSNAGPVAYNNGASVEYWNKRTDLTIPQVGPISATTGFDILAHNWR